MSQSEIGQIPSVLNFSNQIFPQLAPSEGIWLVGCARKPLQVICFNHGLQCSLVLGCLCSASGFFFLRTQGNYGSNPVGLWVRQGSITNRPLPRLWPIQEEAECIQPSFSPTRVIIDGRLTIKNCRGLRFYFTSKLTSYSATVSWRLADTWDDVCQRQRTECYSSSGSDSIGIDTSSLKPNSPFPLGSVKRARSLCAERVVLLERNPEFREPESFILVSLCLCSGGDTL